MSEYTAIANLLALPEGVGNKDSLASTINSQAYGLAQAEAALGFGGNFIETVTKHKLVNVGLVFNGFASTRYNKTAKTITEYYNNTGKVTTTIPAIEYTHIDDMPGGNYTVSAGNRYNLLVGSGGIDIKTTGPINMGGTIVALAGKQVNIASSDDTNIDGGTNLSIISNIMSLRTRNRQQVVIDDNLGISQNVIIGGGAYVKGETYLQHVTAPVEFQVTESTTITDTAAQISKAGGGVINSGDTVTIVINQAHTHYFKNLPLQLVADSTTLNTQAAAVNGPNTAVAANSPTTHHNTAGSITTPINGPA